MTRAWLIVTVLWTLGRLVKESIQPTELGWGMIVLLAEIIYVTVLAVCIMVFSSTPVKGVSGISATVAGTLLGMVLPLFWVFSGDHIPAIVFLCYAAPGFSIGLIFACLLRKHA